MKNTIIIILVVLLIALAVFVVKREGISNVEQLTSKVEEAVQKTVDKVESKLQVSSEQVPAALKELPSDTAVSIVFPSKAIAPAIDHLNNFLIKVKSSSLGKKLEIEKMITEGMKTSTSSNNPFGENQNTGDFSSDDFPAQNDFGAANAESGKSQPSLEEILKTIQNFEKLEILLRAKTLEGKSTPVMKINASFKDDNYGKQLQGLLDSFVEMSQQSDGPQLKKDTQDPQTYIANIKPPFAPVEVLARVKAGGKDINATLGVIAGPISTSAEKPTDKDNLIARSSTSKDAVGAYFNFNNIKQIIDVFLAIVPAEQKPEIELFKKALDTSIGAYSEAAGTSVFEKGFKANACTRFAEGGATGFAPIKAAISSSESNKSSFYKLIGPRTTFAIRADTAFATAGLESMIKTFSSQDSANSANKENAEVGAATEQLISQLKLAQEELKQLKIKDIGLVANAPTVSFVPDVGIYLEHENGVTIEQFATVLQGLFKKLAPPSMADFPAITVSKDANGQTQIVIPAMDGYQVSFKAISNTQIFGSIQDQFTEDAKNSLASKETFIDDAKLASKGVNLKISENDNFYYLSTSSLMPLVRQFAPFITMSKPELKINDAELTQFLDLFDFNLLATRKNTSPENLVVCSSDLAAVY